MADGAMAVLFDLSRRVADLEKRVGPTYGPPIRREPSTPARRVSRDTQALLDYWSTLQRTDPDAVDADAIRQWLKTPTKRHAPGATEACPVTKKGNYS
ncbi:hypothetical protein HDC37_002375 [Microbacterium sp. AK009]|uniref:hypothetical protein n=1 Tax=Microbacterium sp. AK009 TaxID=2723068 RepID=UPI0015C715DB|nr:hypothetical protein [Microbacterium sp. AK009]NYF17530.1 hypothetical protein [Microbacterium sp. AK009]